jgi:hypothetical protein
MFFFGIDVEKLDTISLTGILLGLILLLIGFNRARPDLYRKRPTK